MNKSHNLSWIIAGILNALTALLHVIGGQIDLITPLFHSDLDLQVQTELLGAWHMVTVLLFATSVPFLLFGFNQSRKSSGELISFLSYLYIFFALVFIGAGLFKGVFAPQWILLLPIGILGLVGLKKGKPVA